MSYNTSASSDEQSGRSEFEKKSLSGWFEKRRNVDDTNGLWRIHDNLYDLGGFVDKHPGGSFWIKETKGLDITDAYESHHIKPDAHISLLKHFYVGKATKPRSSPYTFNDDGFYRTLKRKVAPILKTLPKSCRRTSNLYTDLLFVTALGTACSANYFFSYATAIVCGLISGLLLIASHNYCHQRDNFRMFYSDIFMLNSRGFRVVHIISHHLNPNTTIDLQYLLTLPLINLFPQKKSFYVKYFSWIIFTLFVSPLFIIFFTILDIKETITKKKNYKEKMIPLFLPLVMYGFGGQSLLLTVFMWQVIIICTSFVYTTIAFTTIHAHPDLYVEGDALRPKEEMDWGINQLDTVYDRKEIIGNHFFSLVTFGDHALHHLFPAIDHGYLIHLYPVLLETLKEFNIKNINITTFSDIYMGFFKQSAREIPKLLPPMLPVK